jgi:hypothetical protein
MPPAPPAPAPPPRITPPSPPRDVVIDSFRPDVAAADAARTLEQAVAAVAEFEQPASPPSPAGVVAQRRTSMGRNVAVAGAAIAVIALVAVARRPAHTNVASAAVAPVAAPKAAPASTAQPAHFDPESIPVEVPKWRRTAQSRWARDGSRTMGFEVEAEREVAVYQDRVRPVLAVRCVARTTEVFVVMQSAATIENASDTHTVKIGFDGEPDTEQQWLDSIDKQALFSPDGQAFAAKLAAARRLRFSFRPFGAPPATVEFDVHGFDVPMAAMSKACAPVAKRAAR